MSTVSVIGVYLPSLDYSRLLKYLADETSRYINFAIPELRAKGFLQHLSDEAVRARAEEIAEETQHELKHAALIELEVRADGGPFDISSVEEAWEPAYITSDGQQLLEDVGLSPSAVRAYRVAFWVHGWDDKKPTRLSGMHELPPCSPVPERLWRLVPYALVD